VFSHEQLEPILDCSDEMEFLGNHPSVTPANVYVASCDELMNTRKMLMRCHETSNLFHDNIDKHNSGLFILRKRNLHRKSWNCCKIEKNRQLQDAFPKLAGPFKFVQSTLEVRPSPRT
jgi:hypothetical protein